MEASARRYPGAAAVPETRTTRPGDSGIIARMNPRIVDMLVVGILLFLGWAIRYPQIHDSLWLDELHTSWTVDAGLGEVAPRAQMGNNQPAWFYLEYCVTRCLGVGEFSLRLISLVSGLACIVTALVIAWRMTGSRCAAIVAGSLVLTDPNALFFSIEARPYALVQWVGLIQVAAFNKWFMTLHSAVTSDGDAEAPTDAACARVGVAATRRWGVAWWVLSVLLFQLHCTTFLLPLAQLALALVFAPGRSSRIAFCAVWFLFVGTTLLSLPGLMDIYDRRAAWNAFVRIPSAMRLLDVFPLGAYLFPVSLLCVLEWGMRHFGWQSHDASACVGRAESRGGAKAALHHRAPATESIRRRDRQIVFVTLQFALPLLIAFLLTRTDTARLFFRRYLMVVSLLPMLLAGLLVARIRGVRFRVAAAVLVILVGVAWEGPLNRAWHSGKFVRRSQEDWRSVMTVINRRSNAGDVVYLASDLIESERLHDFDDYENARFRSYCAYPLEGLYAIRDDLVLISLPCSRCGDFLRQHDLPPADWIVSRRNDAERVRELLSHGSDGEARPHEVLHAQSPLVIRCPITW